MAHEPSVAAQSQAMESLESTLQAIQEEQLMA